MHIETQAEEEEHRIQCSGCGQIVVFLPSEAKILLASRGWVWERQGGRYIQCPACDKVIILETWWGR